MDYEQELEKAEAEIRQAAAEIAAAMSLFVSTLMEASGYVPTFEGEDAAVLIAMGIAL